MQKRGKTTWSSEEIPGCEKNTTASTAEHIATSLSLLTWSVDSESICFNESGGSFCLVLDSVCSCTPVWNHVFREQ